MIARRKGACHAIGNSGNQFGVVCLSTAPAMASQSRLARKLQGIEKACKLPSGTLTADHNEVHFAPSPSEKCENVDYALAKIRKGYIKNSGFIGNAADPSAVLKEPERYVVEGTTKQIADLSAAVSGGDGGRCKPPIGKPPNFGRRASR